MGCGASTPAPKTKDKSPSSSFKPLKEGQAREATSNYAIVFVFGHDASGKQAICEELCGEFGGQYLHMANMIRDEVDAETPLGEEMADMIRQVPSACNSGALPPSALSALFPRPHT